MSIITVYTGRTVKSAKFDYNYVGLKEAIDQEGPGFYFSTGENVAEAYAGENGIIITAEVDIKKFLTYKNKPKLKDVRRLILSAPNLEDTLTNFDQNYYKALNSAIKAYMEYYDSALDSYQTLCNDFYKYEPVQYLMTMIKLGYNGHLGEVFDDGQHVVVYNNKIIKVINVVDVGELKLTNESKFIEKILKESKKRH